MSDEDYLESLRDDPFEVEPGRVDMEEAIDNALAVERFTTRAWDRCAGCGDFFAKSLGGKPCEDCQRDAGS